MEVPIDDLLSPVPPAGVRGSPRNKTPNNLLRPVSNHPHTSRIDADSEAASSMRVSVLSRNLNSRRGTASVKDNASVHSSASSIRSARSSVTTSSAASDSTIGRSSRADTANTGMSPARRIVQDTRARDAARVASTVTKDRPDSKLTPASPSPPSRGASPTPQPLLKLPTEEVDQDDQRSVLSEGGPQDDEDDRASVANSEAPTEPDSTSPSTPVKKTVITRASLASVTSRVSTTPRANVRNKSSSASIHSQASTTRKPTASVTSRASLAKSTTTSSSRPVSRGSTRTSTASTLSRTSTARSTITTSSRPVSSVSTTSAASTNNHRTSTVTTESTGSYRTASSGLSTPQARSRKSSAASTASVRTAGPSPTSPISPRTRKTSGASVSSVTSTTTSSAYGTAKSSVSKTAPPPVPHIDPTKLSPAAAKAKSTSIRSVRSTSSIKKAAAVGNKGSTSSQKTSPVSSAPVSPADTKSTVPLPIDDKENRGNDASPEEFKNTSSTITIKPRVLVETDSNVVNQNEHKKTDSTTSTGSNATIKRKKSNETIIADVQVPSTSTPRTSGDSLEKTRHLDKPQPPLPAEIEEPPSVSEGAPRGATLEIGIPCIVSSKRKRFKAYARYIGEVEGEYGPWVGVEVPIPLGESWADRDIDSGWQGTQWNDGTWGGIRYFEIGNRGSDWDYSYDDRATRRRRVDGGSSVTIWSKDKTGLKREGDQLMMGMERMKRMRSVSPAISDSSGAESRGLFVRPQQVLYVVDAVEDL